MLAHIARAAGATFPAPIYAKWASDYNKATGVKVNYQSIGSGGGIKQIDSKTVDFGASDMPQTDEVLKTKGQMQFPTVLGGVVPVINVKTAHTRIGWLRSVANIYHAFAIQSSSTKL